MIPPTITTERLVLRPFRTEDAQALTAILEQDGVLKYFPSSGEPPTIEKTQRFIARQQRGWEEMDYAWWAVEERSSGDLLGWSGLQYLPETDETEIGYLLRVESWGRGLATEGAIEGIRFGFETAGLAEIIGLAHPENVASRRVLEKIGMAFDKETEYFEMAVARYALRREAYDLARQST